MRRFLAAAAVMAVVLTVRATLRQYLTGKEDAFMLVLALLAPAAVLHYWPGQR